MLSISDVMLIGRLEDSLPKHTLFQRRAARLSLFTGCICETTAPGFIIHIWLYVLKFKSLKIRNEEFKKKKV